MFSLIFRLAQIVYSPVELLKVRAQVNRVDNIKYRKEIPMIVRKEGFSGLYKGFVALVLKEMPAWGVYFYSYELLKNWCGIAECLKDSRELNWLNIALLMWCAGVSGQMGWLVCYPYDIIKT